jgi:hypothetical protein
MNQNLRKDLESALKVDVDSLSNFFKTLEDCNLYNNTSMLSNKLITGAEYESIITNTIIQNLKDIKMIMKNKGKSMSSSPNGKQVVEKKDNKEIISNIGKNIKSTYDELKNDLINLFKKYSLRMQNIIESINNKTIFKFVCNAYTKYTIDQLMEDDKYILKGKNLCLIGDRPMNNPIEKWKIIIDKPVSFSCCGFGIGSLSDIKINESLSSNNNNVLMCLCCNGPWSAKGMKIINTTNKLGPRLMTEEKKEVIFEINRNEDLFKIYDAGNVLHATFNLSTLAYKDNLVPIINCTTGVTFNFKISST